MRLPGWKTARSAAQWLHGRFANFVLILGYHRVAETAVDPHNLCVRPSHFAEQMEVLRRQVQVIDLATLAAGLQTGNLPRRAAVITFDDGYLDILGAAWPILAARDLPAAVFAVSGLLGEQFWWDKESGEPPAVARAMTADELRQLSDGGLITIGSHTVSHPPLTSLPAAQREAELRDSRQTLSEIIGKPVAALSYPHGDNDGATRQMAQQAGYQLACASQNGIVHKRQEPFALPRFWVPDWDGERFGRWLVRWI
jgi:peptidoglycan/xylan/chitin deacetylase (PgdA/CDA1 family)